MSDPRLRQHKPPLFRINAHVIDMSRVAAIEWWWEDVPPEQRVLKQYDEYPTLCVWFIGPGADRAHAALELQGIPPHLYEAFVEAWEAAR